MVTADKRKTDYTSMLIDKETHWEIKTLAFERRMPMTELIRILIKKVKDGETIVT